MQEEVENRTVNLAITTTRLTVRTIIAGIRKFFYCFHRNHSSHIISETTSAFSLDFSRSFLRCPLFPILHR